MDSASRPGSRHGSYSRPPGRISHRSPRAMPGAASDHIVVSVTGREARRGSFRPEPHPRGRPGFGRRDRLAHRRGGSSADKEHRTWPRHRGSPPPSRWTGTRSGSPTARMVSANNVDQELGWCREEFKKIGVEYAYFRSTRENNWYPHYIHNLDNLIRFGGLYPPIARARRPPPDRLLGATMGLRGRLHGCARERRHLPDGGPEGQEGRPHQEPEHHQERLVAHPGAHWASSSCSGSTT